MAAHDPDAALVQASRRGDAQAFEHLVERHKSLVFAICLAATGDRCDAEDTAQDTFLAAWNTLERLREPEKLRPWLCGIARNLAAKSHRRTRRRRPSAAEAAEPEPMPTPLETLMSRETEAQVRDALLAMPETYREPLVLFYQEERSIRDVASALGLSVDAVKQRLTRGRRILEKGIGEECFCAVVRRAVPSSVFTAGVLAAIGSASSMATAATTESVLNPSLSKGALMTSMKTKFTIAAAVVAASLGGLAWTQVERSSSTDIDSDNDVGHAAAPVAEAPAGARRRFPLSDDSHAAVPDSDSRVRELEARIAELEDELALSKNAPIDTESQLEFFNLTHRQKLDLAAACEIRSDFPSPLDGEAVAGLDLTDLEAQAWRRAMEKFDRDSRGKLAALWEEATGEPGKQVDWRESEPIFTRMGGDAPDLILHMAEERAGLREAPSDLAGRSLYERWSRAFWGRGDDFEVALAGELGPERAHELRAANDGWPGPLRMFRAACPPGPDAGE